MSSSSAEPAVVQPSATHSSKHLAHFESSLKAFSRRPRDHKRIRFVNRTLLEKPLVETKLQNYLEANLSPERMAKLTERLEDCDGECRIVEMLVDLVYLAEQRIEQQSQLFVAIRGLMRRVAQTEGDIEDIVTKCALMVFDAFHCLTSVKRMLLKISSLYHVPIYYEAEGMLVAIRPSVLVAHKNLNIIIDDLQALSEALWMVRNAADK